MSKIKSKRAKECSDRYISNGVHKGVHRYKYVIQAIEFAEKDAEERAVKAANELCDELEPIFLHPMKREWLIDKFKAFYNNGGQSDE